MSVLDEAGAYNDGVADANTTHASVESQSTQLLDFVLGRAEPALLGNPVNQVPAREQNEPNVDPRSSGGAGDTSLSSASASVAGPYHFHGLATTQSPHSATSAVAPDSQKENTLERDESLDKRPVDSKKAAKGDSSRAPRVLAPGRSTGVRTTSLPDHSLSPRTPAHSAKAVTFLSPSHTKPQLKTGYKQPAPPAAPMRFRTEPAPLRGQDSFGGPTASQVEGQFIANSSIFARPLDELGQSDSQEQEQDQAGAGKQSAQPAGDMTKSTSSGGDTRAYTLSSVTSHGRVLVVDSDTSGSSQESTHLSQEATQLISTPATNFTNPNANTTHTSNSTNLDSDSQNSTEPTQIISGPNATSLPGSTNLNQSSIAASSVGGPRSLISTIPKEKQHRYIRHYKEAAAPSAGNSEANQDTAAATSSKKSKTDRTTTSAIVEPSPSPDEEIVQDSEAHIDSELLADENGKQEEEEEEEEEEAGRGVTHPSESEMPDASRQSRVAVKGSDESEDDGHKKSPEKLASRQSKKSVQQPTTPRRQPPKPSKLDSDKPLAAGRKIGAPAAIKTASRASPTPKKAGTPIAKSVAGSERRGAAAKAPVRATEPAPEPQSEPRGRGRGRKAEKAQSKQRVPASAPSSKASFATSKKRFEKSPEGSEPRASARSSKQSKQTKQAEEEDTEVATELAEDEHMGTVDEEEEELESAAASARKNKKRKREVPPPSKNMRARQGKQAVKATGSVQRPPAKKRRISESIANTEFVAARFGAGRGTQVFALFKGDSCFYGAEVHALSNGRAHVKYFDGLEDTSIGINQLRRFELREGDTVIPDKYKAMVIDDSDWASDNEVRVRYVEGPDEDEEHVFAADDLRIPSRTIQVQWKDRTIELPEIIPAVGKKMRDTPSPSKMSVMSARTGKSGRYKVLSKCGFVLTLKSENKNWIQEKARLETAVREGGGTVFADWPDLFSLQGKACNGNARWTLNHRDIKFVLKDKSVDKVLLLSDQHSQKPRYLLALALGIPCVDAEWVHALLAGEEAHWSRFLLPAGCSEPLGTKVSQLVDLAWGEVEECLTGITESEVPLKVLKGARVLCVGTDFFPPHSKKQSVSEQEKSKESSRYVPRIIAAMGADVEAVAEVRHCAFAYELKQYDYILLKDVRLLPDTDDEDLPLVNVTWIKECLIAGRLLPLPDESLF